MEAEDIIRQKGWGQLNIEEKNFLLPLASDEEEFNLLKKMLLVAGEEVSDIPEIDSSVKIKLYKALQPAKPVTPLIKKWHYAAAVVLLIAFSAWFIIQKKNSSAIIVKITTDKKPDDIKPTPQENTVIVKKETTPLPPSITNTQEPKRNSIHIYTHKQIINIPPNNFTAINTSVNKNADLMAFVTEVYD